MSKKLFFLAPLCALVFLFASCSFLSDLSDEKDGASVSFTIDSQTAQNLLRQSGVDFSASERAGIVNLQGLYINISLRGSVSASQFSRITSNGVSVTFNKIPVGKQVYAYAEIYTDPSNVLYKGKSDSKETKRGSNSLSVKLMTASAFNARYPNEPANTNNPTAPAPGSGGNTPGTEGDGNGGNGGNGGGTGGNTNIAPPADFVFVEGDTINASFTGSILNGRTITIPDMYVCSHEVTQKEYSQYMITKGAATNDSYYDTQDQYGKGDDYPVYNIEWTEAVMYCNLRSEADGLDPAYYIVLGTNDTDSLDFTEGTRTYDVRDWKANWKSGTNDVIEEVDGKYYVARLQITQAMYAANRGITLDKTRNGYRLLTHAEWEYCARGGKDGIAGTQTTYSGSDTADSVAWYYNNSGDNGTSTNGKSHVVCTKAPNSLGIYDMSGNIAEMVHDWKGRTIDATTPETGFVYDSSDNRSMAAVGGSWYRGSNDSKVTGSSTYSMDYRDKDIGFRICRNKTSRTVGAFSGIWAKAPVADYYLTTGDPINWLLQNNAAASSDYASFDSSKLVVKEIESGSLINTYTGAAGGTVTLTTQSNGILWHMTNTKTGTGYRTYIFIYDGVEVTRAFVNSNY